MASIKSNYHTHTTFCDGKDTPQELSQAAFDLGFTHLGFSGHSVLPFSTQWHIKLEQYVQYIKAVNECKKQFAGRLEILCGFEADYISGVSIPSLHMYQNLFEKEGVGSVDFVIGSVHYIPCDSGIFAIDSSEKELKWGLENAFCKDAKQLVCKYFALEKQMLCSGDFCMIAHIDLIRKYNERLHLFNEKDSWYEKEIKALVKSIKEAGVVVEVNTGALSRACLNSPYPNRDILELLCKNNVPITLASDCHDKAQLDAYFTKALALIKQCGYKELSYFTKTSGTLSLQFYSI